MFGCTISFHRSVGGVNRSKFEPIRQQGFIHRRLLDEKFRCEEPQWYDIRIAFQRFLNFGIFAMKNLSGVNWLTGQLGIVGPTGAETKKMCLGEFIPSRVHEPYHPWSWYIYLHIP